MSTILNVTGNIFVNCQSFLSLDKARTVIVIVSWLDRQKRFWTLLNNSNHMCQWGANKNLWRLSNHCDDDLVFVVMTNASIVLRRASRHVFAISSERLEMRTRCCGFSRVSTHFSFVHTSEAPSANTRRSSSSASRMTSNLCTKNSRFSFNLSLCFELLDHWGVTHTLSHSLTIWRY